MEGNHCSLAWLLFFHALFVSLNFSSPDLSFIGNGFKSLEKIKSFFKIKVYLSFIYLTRY